MKKTLYFFFITLFLFPIFSQSIALEYRFENYLLENTSVKMTFEDVNQYIKTLDGAILTGTPSMVAQLEGYSGSSRKEDIRVDIEYRHNHNVYRDDFHYTGSSQPYFFNEGITEIEINFWEEDGLLFHFLGSIVLSFVIDNNTNSVTLEYQLEATSAFLTQPIDFNEYNDVIKINVEGFNTGHQTNHGTYLDGSPSISIYNENLNYDARILISHKNEENIIYAEEIINGQEISSSYYLMEGRNVIDIDIQRYFSNGWVEGWQDYRGKRLTFYVENGPPDPGESQELIYYSGNSWGIGIIDVKGMNKCNYIYPNFAFLNGNPSINIRINEVRFNQYRKMRMGIHYSQKNTYEIISDYERSFPYFLNEGYNYIALYLWVDDNANGEWEVLGSEIEFTFILDNTPPAIHINSINYESWKKNSFNFNFSTDDEFLNSGISGYYISGGPWIEYNNPVDPLEVYIDVNVFNCGMHTITVEAVDFMDEFPQDHKPLNTITRDYNFYIDTISPVINILSPPSLRWQNGSRVDILADFTEEHSGINLSSFQYSIPGITNGFTYTSIPGKTELSEKNSIKRLSIFEEGMFQYKLQVDDYVPNTSEVVKGYIYLDNEAPELTLNAASKTLLLPPNEFNWFKEDVILAIDVNDRNDSDSLLPVSGIEEVKYRITLAGESTGGWIFLPVNIIEETIREGEISFQNELQLSDEGEQSFEFNIRDVAGNITQGITQINIDKTSPSVNPVEIDSVTNDGWINADTIYIYTQPFDGNRCSGIKEVLWADDASLLSSSSKAEKMPDGSFRAGPFSREMEYKIYFKAIDKAYNESDIESVVIKIDRTAPVITLVNSVPETWHSDDIIAALSGNDTYGIDNKAGSGIAENSWEISEDNTNWQNLIDTNRVVAGSNISLEFSEEGDKTWYIRVKDRVDLVSTPIEIHTMIDTLAPSVTAEDTPWLSGDTAEITVNADDGPGGSCTNPETFQYSFNNIDFFDVQSYTAVEGNDNSWIIIIPMADRLEGPNSVYIRVWDNAGQSHENSVPDCYVNIDRKPPSIDTGAVPTGWSNNETAEISFDATPGSPLIQGSLSYSLDGGAFTTTGITWINVTTVTIPLGDDGVYDLEIRISDQSDLPPAEAKVTFYKDTINPELTANDTDWTSDTFQWVALTASDPVPGSGLDLSTSEVSYRYEDEITWNSVAEVRNNGGWEAKVSISQAEGSYNVHTLHFVVKDQAGNSSEESSCLVRIDKASPTFDIYSIDNTWINTDPIIGLDGTGAEIDSLNFTYGFTLGTVNNTDVIPLNTADGWTTTIPGLLQGKQTVFFNVKDMAGNAAGGSINVWIDTEKPVVSMMSNTIVSDNQLILSLTDNLSDPDGTTIKYGYTADKSLDTGFILTEHSTHNFTLTLPVSGDGPRTVYLYLEDQAGNIVDLSFDIMLDGMGPELTLTAPTGWQTKPSLITSTAVDKMSEVDGNSWYIQLTPPAQAYDENDWLPIISVSGLPGEAEYEVTQNGSFDLWFKVSDAGGNWGYGSTGVMIDSEPPEILLKGGMTDWANIPSATIEATVKDSTSGINLSSLEYSMDGSVWTEMSGSTLTVDTDGERFVYFRAYDQAGNPGYAEARVLLDNSGPVIEIFELINTYVNKALLINKYEAADSYTDTDAGSWDYRFDEDGEWGSLSGDVDVSGLTEGPHTLNIRVSDVLGNSSTLDMDIIVDRTPPELINVAFSSSGILLSEDDYISQTQVTISPEGTDNEWIEERNLIFNYMIFTEYTATPDFSNAVESTDGTFTITGLNEGPNFLYYRLIDYAGNAGVIGSGILRVDTASPGTPTITGISHPGAEEVYDAVSARDALFLLKPSTGSLSGVSAFEYTLLKGEEVHARGTVDDERLEFTELPDNEEEEFYILSVRSVGGNGRIGTPAEYRFRIDTNPPVNLRVYSASHANPELFYNSAMVSFIWNRPLDFTGVKSFYFKSSESEILPEPLTGEFGPDETWTRSGKTAVAIDFEALTGNKSGTCYFSVCAEDYAGNKQFSQALIHYDLLKPAAGEVFLTTDQLEKKAVVEWLEGSDNTALDYIELELARDSTGTLDFLIDGLIRDPLPGMVTFEGLKDSESYTLYVKLFDTAGNQQVVLKEFTLAGETAVTDTPVPFNKNVKGFYVSGEYSGNPDKQIAWLTLDKSLDFRLINPVDGSETAVTEVDLTGLRFDVESKEFLSGDFVGEYKITLADFTFAGSGFSLSESGGLVFHSLTLPRKTEEDVKKSFTYNNVNITAPPRVLFSPVITTEADNFTYQSSSGWSFNEIPATGLEQENWLLNSGLIDFSTLLNYRAYRIVDSHEILSAPFTQITISPAGSVEEGFIIESFYLEAAENIFDVASALVRDDKIIILKANLIFGSALTSDEVILENFSITVEGVVIEEPGFTSSDFIINQNGHTYTVNSLGFSGNSLIIQEGVVESGGTPLIFSGATLSSGGITYDTDIIVPYVEVWISGFRLTSEQAKLTDEGLLLETARIWLPDGFGGGSRLLYGTLLSLDNSTVLEAGTSIEEASIESGYGTNIVLRGLSLRAEGLFVNETEVPMPAFIGEGTVVIPDLPLISDGTFGTGSPVETPVVLIIAGFEAEGSDIWFDGNSLVVPVVSVSLTEKYNPSYIEFSGLRFNYQTIMEAGFQGSRLDFDDEGWTFSADALILDESGIHGSVNLELPEAFGNRCVSFIDLRIHPDGSFITGETPGDFYFRLYGWKVRAEGVALDGSQLKITTGTVRLYSIMGNDELVIPDILLSASGELVSCGKGNTDIEFFSTNGYIVSADSYGFTDEGLIVSGRIYFPEALGSDVSLSSVSIFLADDGAVIIKDHPGPVVYKVAGWDVNAGGLTVDREGLTIGLSSMKIFNTVNIDLPEMQFYPDGGMKIAGKGIEGFSHSLGGFTLGVTDVRLNDEGVNVSAYITLPPFFEGAGVYFDSLTIHPDGSITTDAVIPKFGFSLGGFHFAFEDISFLSDRFSMGKAIITLPPEAGSRELRFSNLEILIDGSFSLGGFGMDPFELWGYIFHIENISFSDNVVGLEGNVSFPQDFFFESLSGVSINIDTFNINLDGTIEEFSISIDESLSFPLFDTWEVIIDGVEVNQEQFLITSGQLIFPPEMDIQAVTVNNFSINVVTGDINLGDISINGITKEYEGNLFILDTLKLSEDRGCEFTGSVHLVGNVPGDFYGLTLTVDMFQIRPDFTIGDISATLSEINTPIFDFCELQGGAIGINKTDEQFLFSAEGKIIFGTTFPQGIAGKGVTIYDFIVDVYTGEVLAFKASALVPDFDLFGVSRVEGANIAILLDPTTGLYYISVDGSLAWTSANPEFLVGESITINNFTIDTAGEIKNFEATLSVSGEKDLIEGVKVNGVTVSASCNAQNDELLYGVTGMVKLGDDFPEGLANAEFTIGELMLNGRGDVVTFDILGDFPDNQLFGAFDVEGGSVHLAGGSARGITTTVAGTLRFGNLFPVGLKEKTLSVDYFTINPAGRILEFSASAEDLEVDLFGLTKITADTLSLTYDDATDVVEGDLTGSIGLSTLFPDELRRDPVEINTFKFNTAGEITAFDATLDLPGYRPLLGDFILREGLLTARLAGSAVEFDVEGTIVLPHNFPEGLGDKEIVIDSFKFDTKGNILDCNINTQLTGIILFGSVKIVSGQFSILKQGETDIYLDIDNAVLQLLEDKFPSGVGGNYLTLADFRVDSSGTILDFEAFSDPLTVYLFGVTEMSDTEIHMALNRTGGAVEISVTGKLNLGTSFPAKLRENPIVVRSFKIDTNGTVGEFDASLSLPGDRDILGALILRDADLRASINNDTLVFNLEGQIILSDRFPTGIANAEITITTFRFDQYGSIIAADVATDLVDQKLLGVMKMKNASVSLLAQPGSDPVIEVMCDLYTPGFFPQGLKEEKISVTTFQITTGGLIVRLDAGIENLDASLFGVVDVEGASLGVSVLDGLDLFLEITGTIILPGYLPGDLAELPLRIDRFILSPTDGIIDFKCSVDYEVEFELFAGIMIGFSQISPGRDGLGLKGGISFPSNPPGGPEKFPEGLAGREIQLTQFKMDWDGNVTAVEADLPEASVEMAGFKVGIENLSINADCINIEYLSLALPDSLGGDSVGIKDAGFDYYGNFFGTFVVETFTFDIAGCQLVLTNPDLDIPAGSLSFKSVFMKLPDAIGGQEFTVDGLTISPSGLSIAGGYFSMPDFTIAGGLWFKDLLVELAINGDDYSIEGGGSVFVPGLGEMSTMIGLTNVNTTYPWGLKYARFDFTVGGLGLPVANTGIFINGLKGSIAFGPPGREMPDELKFLFGDTGTRIMVGLNMRDASGAIQGGNEVWINVDTWDWAIKGNISLMYGVIKSRLIASITKHYGFYAALYVQIAFIKGSAYIHIWDENGQSHLCGGIEAQLGIPEGLIFGVWPGEGEEIWLGGVGVEFGDFANGKQGFKAYATLDLVGTVGIFIDYNGKFSFPSMAEYVLKDGGVQGPSTRSTSPQLYTLKARGAVDFKDTRSGSAVKKHYTLIVPGSPEIPEEPSGRSLKSGPVSRNLKETEYPFEDDVEKIFFVARYSEGDPIVTARSPSGISYAEGQAGVEVLRTNRGMILAVENPEGGEWQLDVTNLYDGQVYEITAYGKKGLPEIVVDTPAIKGEPALTGYTVNGRVCSSTGKIPEITFYLAKDNYSFTGEEVGTVSAGIDGSFSYTLDTSGLVEGEYHIFTQAFDGQFTGPRTYAMGSIMVEEEGGSLQAPENLIATVNGTTTLEIGFSNPNGNRSLGFYLYLTDTSTMEEKQILLGYLTNTTLSGLEAGNTYEIRVTAYNMNGDESPSSEVVSLYMVPGDSVINDFDTTEREIYLDLMAGESYKGSIAYNTLDPVETGAAFDYMDYEILEVPEWFSIFFNKGYWPLSGGGGMVNYTLSPVNYNIGDENTTPEFLDLPAPGLYTLKFNLRNMGNRRLLEEVTVNINIDYPQPVISSVSPGEWNNLDTVLLKVTGDNFLRGTQLFLGKNEILVSDFTRNNMEGDIPVGLEAGDYTVTVRGPTGKEARASATVVEQGYSVLGLKTTALVSPGDEETVIFTIRDKNGFIGTALFHVNEAPDGFTITMDKNEITSSEYIYARISVPSGTPAGEYLVTFVSDKDDILPIALTVLEENISIDPHISSLSTDYGYRGEELTIFGYGFGSTGVVTLGGTAQTVVSYSDNTIVIRLDANAVNGDLVVLRDGVFSNSMFFVVKELGFRLIGPDDVVYAQPGDSPVIPVQAAGYADWITFTSYSTDLTTATDKTGLKPNGQVNLTINIPEDMTFGSYHVTLTAESGSYRETFTSEVVVGEAFTITTTELPVGMVSVPYNTVLDSLNGEGNIRYKLSEGTLPPGLSLTPDGRITGLPVVSGIFDFEAIASDVAERTTVRSLTITVEDNSWSLRDKDGGRTSYNPVAAPASGAVKWSSAPVEGTAMEILTGKNRIFVLSDKGVTGLHSENGKMIFFTGGIYSHWAHIDSILYLLDEAGNFFALDADYGRILLQRSGVSRFTTNGSLLYVQEAGTLKVLDLGSGTLASEINSTIPAGAIDIWQGETLYIVNGTQVLKLEEEIWQTVHTVPDPIYNLAADNEGFLLLTESGEVTLFDTDFISAGTLDTGIAAGRILSGSERFYITGETATRGYLRTGLTELVTIPAGSTSAVLAVEKLFIAGAGSLTGVNGYAGSTIWTREMAYADLALAGKILYGLRANGEVDAFNGLSNRYCPETTITISPAEPDGGAGYYTVKPMITLSAMDAESYVEETLYTIGGEEVQSYTDPVTLPEGDYLFKACSTDNHGYREPDNILSFRIDITSPETTLITGGDPGRAPYFISGVTLTFEASDNLSGVESIYYSINGGSAAVYEAPVQLSEQGLYTITYYAVDRAGNLEKQQEFILGIDLEAPEAAARTYTWPGFGVVYLTATDNFSGIDRIEYTLDGNEQVYLYSDTIIFTEMGEHSVAFRAVDKAGRSSVWASISLKLMFGSVSRNGMYGAAIEDKKIWFRANKNNEIIEQEVIVEVTDDMMTLDGSAGLTLIEMEVSPMEEMFSSGNKDKPWGWKDPVNKGKSVERRYW